MKTYQVSCERILLTHGGAAQIESFIHAYDASDDAAAVAELSAIKGQNYAWQGMQLECISD